MLDQAINHLRHALASRHTAVLQAPPGAGKTTLVPLALLDEPWLEGRSIIILEPRRLAARAAAGRMAQLLCESVGDTVGYRIRFDSKVSGKTRIEVLTEGILTRRLQNDPGLEGVGLVIFDEFHERHLHADLALTLCLDARRVLREDLRILVMSATLDGEAVAGLLGDAPLVTAEGRMFPVEVRYVPSEQNTPLPQAMSLLILKALQNHSGDLLAFLPGGGEIRRTQELLDDALSGSVEICPLYGDLPWDAQQRAILPIPGRRKVVLATPIAETSLTIEGISVVVDSGYAKVPRFDPGSGLTRLATMRISAASAEQRAGRAGRLGPGVCYRLWSEAVHRGLIPQPQPEIRGADLAPLALDLALWGVRDANTLCWLDPPPAGAMAQARQLLMQLDAINADGTITPTGREMAVLPLHPRLAHMLGEAKKMGLGAAACDLAAILSERDIMTGDARRSCDIMERLDTLWSHRKEGRPGAQAHGADPAACGRLEQASRQWRRLLHCHAKDRRITHEEAGILLALAYPDRVAQQRSPGDARYLLSGGRGARLPEQEYHVRRPLIVAASVDAGEGEGLIRLAAPVTAEALRLHMGRHLATIEVVRWDDVDQAVIAGKETRLGELVLEKGPLTRPDPERLRGAMLNGIRNMGLEALPWTDAARYWQARVRSLRHWFPDEGWPDVSDAALMNTLEDWLGPHLYRMTRRDHLARVDLFSALKSMTDWNQARRLDEGAPTHLAVPSGSRLPLRYIPGESPVLEVKIQEMFGLADTPRVGWGKVPVMLHLLSPARRPIQVTQDLRGFWDRTYYEVKKELKGRYPKHPWPDDPWNAVPTARTQRKR